MRRSSFSATLCRSPRPSCSVAALPFLSASREVAVPAAATDDRLTCRAIIPQSSADRAERVDDPGILPLYDRDQGGHHLEHGIVAGSRVVPLEIPVERQHDFPRTHLCELLRVLLDERGESPVALQEQAADPAVL